MPGLFGGIRASSSGAIMAFDTKIHASLAAFSVQAATYLNGGR